MALFIYLFIFFFLIAQFQTLGSNAPDSSADEAKQNEKGEGNRRWKETEETHYIKKKKMVKIQLWYLRMVTWC